MDEAKWKHGRLALRDPISEAIEVNIAEAEFVILFWDYLSVL